MSCDVIGNNYKLLFGDCLERMKEIPDGSVDLVLADPPYGTTACKWDSVIDLPLMWEQLKRIVKPAGAIVLTASQPFTTNLISSNLNMFKYCWVWEKSKGSNFVHANYQPLKVHEDICVFSIGGSAQGSKTPMVYNPQHKQGAPYDKGVGHNEIRHLSGGFSKSDTILLVNKTGDRKPRSVIYNKTAESEGKFHPTQKPVELMEYLIKTYTNEGGMVLDFVMGSGSTGVACVKSGRNFVGIEKDEGYFKIAEKRIGSAISDLHEITLTTGRKEITE